MGLGVWDGSLRPRGMGAGQNERSAALALSLVLQNACLHLFQKWFLLLTLRYSLQLKEGRNEL